MDAIIKVPSIEFNEELFKKLEAIISGQDAEITITVKQASEKDDYERNRAIYWYKIDQSINDLETGKGTIFTMDQLEAFIHTDTNA